MSEDALRRALKINTGKAKRLNKDVIYYTKEKAAFAAKVEKASSADPHNLKHFQVSQPQFNPSASFEFLPLDHPQFFARALDSSPAW